MKHRNPFAVFGLSIITFGIYDIYWLVVTKKVLNEKTNHKTPTIWLLFAPIALLTVFYIVLFASLGTAAHSSGFYNTATTNSTQVTTATHKGAFFIALIGVIVFWIVTVITSIYWFFRFSKAINEYTSGKMTTAVTFLVLWVIHLLGVALVQDAFNDMTAAPAGVSGGTTPPAPQAPASPPQDTAGQAPKS